MKRRITLGSAALLLAATCAAQVRGVPASVNSGPGDFSGARGIPASVGSLGPQGYTRPIYNPDFLAVSPPRRDRLGRAYIAAPIPLFYYGGFSSIVYLPQEQAPYVERNARPTPPPEPQKIIIEIRDTRPSPPVVDPKIAAAKEIEGKPAPRPEVDLPRAATVFIFQDGSRKELKDFAITQTELIDLSDGLIRRSPLNALDRVATLKANAEQGVEVHFPATSSD
ncbi:MAG: hypothetical protein ABIP81_08470 [Terriglobales bacterium]